MVSDTNELYDKIADAAQISTEKLSRYITILRQGLKIKARNQSLHI